MLIFKYKDSGADDNVPFLMSGFFTPNAPSYRNSDIPSVYQHHKQVKKREYGDRARGLLVFATTGGFGREVTVFYCQLADLLFHKNNVTYRTILV